MIQALLLFLLMLAGVGAAWADGAASAAAALQAQRRGDLPAAIRLYGEAIRSGQLSPPELAAAYYNRGAAHRKLGEINDAIADYDMSIRLNPDFPPAYDSRGNAHRDKGEIDKAIADYNVALRLKPDFANAHDNRGNAYRDRGEPEKALIDYDAALKLRPDDIVARYNRAHVEVELGRYAAAAGDYRQVIGLAPSNYYPVLLLHLAAKRAGEDDDQEIRRNATRLDRAIWPAPVLALYLGEASPEQVLAAAAADATAKQQRLCEADYYLGMYQLLRQATAQASKLFRELARSCPPGFFERSAALRELKRLEP